MEFFPNSKIIMSIGNLQVTWYAVIILTGAFLAYYLSLKTMRKFGYEESIMENFFISMMPIAIIGARTWYVIFEWSNRFASNPIRVFYFWEGGLAIHGGLLFGILYGIFYFRHYKADLLRVADAIMPNVLLAQAIGRWGNFMNQEAFGQIVDPSYYRFFPRFISDQMYIDGYYRQPMFLYESIANLIGFILIRYVFQKKGKRRHGDLLWAYLMWYGMVRIVIESFRSDSLMIGPFKTAQLISLGFIIIGLLGYMGCFKKLFPRSKAVILFDLDGTLIHSRPLIDASFKHTFAHYLPDKQLTQEELDSFFGPTLDQTFSRYFEPEKVAEVVAYYRAFNKKEHNTYVTLFPEVKETLEALKAQGYKMGVVSNKKRDVVDLGLQYCEIEPYFDVVLGGDELEQVKPNPIGLMQACALLKEGHDNLIYVGDNVNDILTARNLCAYSVAYLNENQKRDEVLAIHPCKTIEHMSELLDIVSSRDEFFDLEEMV